MATPSARLLDMRPIAGPAPVDILGKDEPKNVYVIDGSPGIPDDKASDQAVAQLVGEGVLIEDSRQEFLFHRYWDSVDDMHDYLLSNWGNRNVLPTVEELEPAREVHAAEGEGANVRVSRRMILHGYRVNRD